MSVLTQGGRYCNFNSWYYNGGSNGLSTIPVIQNSCTRETFEDKIYPRVGIVRLKSFARWPCVILKKVRIPRTGALVNIKTINTKLKF